MKTAGQILQFHRLAKKLSIAEVSSITKIRPKQIELIESDNYSKLPSGAVAKGFVRNYGEFFGLKPDYILAIFRRDFVENQQGQIVPRGMVDPVNGASLWTPKSTAISFVSLVFTLFGFYLLYQYRVLTGPPSLQLINPPTDLVTSERSIEVVGTTDPEATVSFHGQVIILDKGGRFSFRAPLESGENTLEVEAISKQGKSVKITRQVTLTN